MDPACCLSRSIRYHDCLNHLDIVHCDEILMIILQSDIKNIYLDDNNIDIVGAVTITEYLESDPPIVRLSLARNRLNDDDAILIRKR